jgi:hypothetical protein|tara:strand:+ start:4001 stop:4627 length:627 start_codon:yes stop_codon:yes gene_type:complete
MTTTNAYSRQPTKQDYADPTKFKFSIAKLPKVEYFCTQVNLPGISISDNYTQPTPFRDIPLPGEKLRYEPLSVTFLVDENLENYQEIHGWLRGLGFPGGHQEFKNLLDGGSDRFPTSKSSTLGDAGRVKFNAPNTGGILSDSTLSILTSKNNPVTEVRFSDCFPISLSSLQYNQQATDTDYLTATVTFEYKIYDFANSQASRTTITTS